MFKNIGVLLPTAEASRMNRLFEEDKIKRYISDYSASSGYRQRSRGPAAKRAKKTNMLHISKRVRRKHRRAAR